MKFWCDHPHRNTDFTDFGGAIICTGVSIGDRSVIGAGSVVIPSWLNFLSQPQREVNRDSPLATLRERPLKDLGESVQLLGGVVALRSNRLS